MARDLLSPPDIFGQRMPARETPSVTETVTPAPQPRKPVERSERGKRFRARWMRRALKKENEMPFIPQSVLKHMPEGAKRHLPSTLRGAEGDAPKPPRRKKAAKKKGAKKKAAKRRGASE